MNQKDAYSIIRLDAAGKIFFYKYNYIPTLPHYNTAMHVYSSGYLSANYLFITHIRSITSLPFQCLKQDSCVELKTNVTVP